MLWVVLILATPPTLLLALAIWLYFRLGKPPMGDPDSPRSLDLEIAEGNIRSWGTPPG